MSPVVSKRRTHRQNILSVSSPMPSSSTRDFAHSSASSNLSKSSSLLPLWCWKHSLAHLLNSSTLARAHRIFETAGCCLCTTNLGDITALGVRTPTAVASGERVGSRPSGAADSLLMAAAQCGGGGLATGMRDVTCIGSPCMAGRGVCRGKAAGLLMDLRGTGCGRAPAHCMPPMGGCTAAACPAKPLPAELAQPGGETPRHLGRPRAGSGWGTATAEPLERSAGGSGRHTGSVPPPPPGSAGGGWPAPASAAGLG
mmetsp:Transcript_81965/g.244455  ORF Transcript_81965/g.244455 Transcript_81965/m.244455 type:complete len:256 (-) Transcript_81965:144-911(-)